MLDSGPSTPVLTSLVSMRRPLYFMIWTPTNASASSWRTTGSAVAPFLCATSISSDVSRWNAICWARNAVPRSKPSVAIATFQPSFTSPTTFALSVRASSKKTSLNSAVPVICFSGRT